MARPGGQGGRPAFLRATAQFQYSKVVPIKAEITAKLEEQARATKRAEGVAAAYAGRVRRASNRKTSALHLEV